MTWSSGRFIAPNMEIRFKVDDSFIEDINQKLRGGNRPATGSAVTQNALALFKWAIDETSKGRKIMSSDQGGGNIVEVVTPMLTDAKPRQET